MFTDASNGNAARWEYANNYNLSIDLQNEGHGLNVLKKFEEAIKVLERGLGIKRKLFASNDIRIAITALELADAYTGAGRFADAERLCKEGIYIRRAAKDIELRYALDCWEDIQKAKKKAGLPMKSLPCDRVGCVESGLHRCVRCLVARYCSVDCQKMDWKEQHKKQCLEAVAKDAKNHVHVTVI